MMEGKKLTERIKQRFGTVSNFCRQNGLDRQAVAKILWKIDNSPTDQVRLRFEGLQEHFRLAPMEARTDDILESERMMFMQDIKRNFMTVKKFCFMMDVPESTARQIINGRRKKLTPIVREVLDKARNLR